MSRPLAPKGLELIRWLDPASSADDGWKREQELEEPTEHLCCVAGWVLKETDTVILVASAVSDSDYPDDLDTFFRLEIPKVCVVDRYLLGVIPHALEPVRH